MKFLAKLKHIKNTIFEYYFQILLKSKIKSDYIRNNFTYFINSNGINEWGKCFNAYFKLKKELIGCLKASDEDKYELETYEFYSGYIGEKINDVLRGKDNSKLYDDRISTLTKSLSQFRLKSNLVVIRRMPKNIFNDLIKKNNIIDEKGFLSTSVNLSYRLDNEGQYRPINNEVLMLLKVPKETSACYVEHLSGRKEYELIIQKNTKIKIEQNINIFNNVIVTGEIR